MIYFFQTQNATLFAVGSNHAFSSDDISKLDWLFGGNTSSQTEPVDGWFIGPRKEMITPWSTNAVEITQNMGIQGINRIEEFHHSQQDEDYDPMLQAKYDGLDDSIFQIDKLPEDIISVEDIAEYNKREGLALSDEEVEYLEEVSQKIGRPLTDSEVFGFSQVNSEHCRHKIFNGTFIIDGEEKTDSLFKLIRKTSNDNPNRIVSAYKDNVAFVEGPVIEQFAPQTQDKSDYFEVHKIDSVLSLKAETHNFPTTVEPFNGAATGSGGEIRDRMAGGTASIPLAGTAVYMTSYPRLEDGREWESTSPERKWLYQTPLEILIKASNGASDFGNKFGQPLISGSLLTFEKCDSEKKYGFDKVIMLAGGIGFGKKEDSLKKEPGPGDKIVILGGDNYRIGMGGGAVSSVATGEFGNTIELNAIQRSNPEMQKRVFNAIRAMSESGVNPIVSLHDHGAGGHLNCLSELIEDTGGHIDITKLPVGDPTLSAKEVIGNESQERMGLVIKEEDIDLLRKVAERERSPMYVVGEATDDHNFQFENPGKNEKPIDLKLDYLFGSSPKTILIDEASASSFGELKYEQSLLEKYLTAVLKLESVACKDWLTNKVDRSVTGKVAMQQCTGPLQLPLNNLGIMALDYKGVKGVATSIGHAPVSALIDPDAGSKLSIAEALTNIIWAPIQDGLKGISLSANWMWPAKNDGENARLYEAVEAVSEFAIDLGINVPTGKDSLSMTQKYPDGDTVYSPGTVIISSVGEVIDIKKAVTPVVSQNNNQVLFYLDLSGDSRKLGGSSLSQVLGNPGAVAPTVRDAGAFAEAFENIQKMILDGCVVAGHDISAGGMITTLLEMTFSHNGIGLNINLDNIDESDLIKLLFSENPGIVFQARPEIIDQYFSNSQYRPVEIGRVTDSNVLTLNHQGATYEFNIEELRDTWFRSSYLFDKEQSGEDFAESRFRSYKKNDLDYIFPKGFNGLSTGYEFKGNDKPKAAIIREKGVNGDREMAYSLYQAGFNVKDVHMTDLISGREDLSDINFIVFVGGFSNSDVLGSAKGWAGAFIYNPKAKKALDNFYSRPDTLSLGVCNGCQLMMELNLLYPDQQDHPKMHHNASGKFESAFLTVDIPDNDTVMFKNLSGSRLGVWVAHGEGKFEFAGPEDEYNILGKYHHHVYPGNPNGSDFDAAIVCSKDGRHTAMMPHLERSLFSWQWPWYVEEGHEISPWIEVFTSARDWIISKY